jgi:hypothetical protein
MPKAKAKPKALKAKPKKQPKVMGRPTGYTTAIGKTICERMCKGESLLQITRDPKMPSRSMVMRWVNDKNKKDFRDNYMESRELLHDYWAEEQLDIADDGTNDWMERNGTESVNGEHIQRSRLRIDTRKWLLSKLAARKYGDRAAIQVTGADDGPIEVTEISNKEIARRALFLLQNGLEDPKSTGE